MFFRRIIDFYINSSIHVALSASALVCITQYMFRISNDCGIVYFTFFGTIVGYNFVKYDALARVQKLQIGWQLKGIIALSFLSLIASGLLFLKLQLKTQLYAVVFLVITLLYTLSFFPNKKNARNWAGVKIYIVALCWVGVTVALPVINAGIDITANFYLKCIQRFILVFVLILIFEIIDLAHDDPHLQTVPQQIGVGKTKKLGYILLAVFCALELFNSNFNYNTEHLIFAIISVIVALFLAFVNEKCPKYYTSFWAESVPVLWWLMLFLTSKYNIW